MKVFLWRVNPITSKIVLLLTSVFVICSLVSIYRIRQCDETAQKRLVETPDSKIIPKFDIDIKVEKFSSLSKTCGYVDNKIHCPDVRKYGETVLRQAQLVIMRMLTIVNLICRKHDIKYWMQSGTLLGAYRDGFIIAWDNDGDIGMLKEDYLKLIEAFKKDLPGDLYLQNGDDEPLYKKTKVVEAKLRDRNSCYGHCIRTGCKFHDGIQLDIFVFERQQDNKNVIISYPSPRFKLNADDIFPLIDITLDNIQLYAPLKTKQVLTQLFGNNFMTPPKKQCSEFGFIAIPWYSCDFIESRSPIEKNKILQVSMAHDSYYFWYFG